MKLNRAGFTITEFIIVVATLFILTIGLIGLIKSIGFLVSIALWLGFAFLIAFIVNFILSFFNGTKKTKTD